MRWLGWGWENGACACRACVEAGRVPGHYEGSGFRVSIHEVTTPNYSGQCVVCGVPVVGEHCSFDGKKDMADTALMKVESDAIQQQAREVIARVLWTRPEAQERLQSFEISSDEHQDFAAALLREIKTEWASVEAKRKTITKPANDLKKAADNLFKPTLVALEKAEATLKSKIATYLTSKERANTAALQAAAAATTPEAAQQAIAHVAPVAPPAGVSVRKVWRFEVVDQNLVPRELCSPDAKKIEAAFHGGATAIPGVRFFQEDQVSARRG